MISAYVELGDDDFNEDVTVFVEDFMNNYLGLYDERDKSIIIDAMDEKIQGCVGWCAGDRSQATIELYLPEIQESWGYFMEVLTHELIHAKQLFLGELVNDNPLITLWKGEEYVNTPIQSEEEYKALPWEAEAYARQEEYLNCEIPMYLTEFYFSGNL